MHIISFAIPNNHRKSICMYMYVYISINADIEVGVCMCVLMILIFYPIAIKHLTNLSTLKRSS